MDNGNACNFYTVRYDDQDISETDKFYDDFFVEGHELENDMRVIDALLDELRTSGTSVIRRNRDEARVFALPPEAMSKECSIQVFGNNLRLYYVELSNNVIILLGGGIAHESRTGKVPIQFQDAQIFSKKIEEAKNNTFEVINGRIIPTSGREIIIY